MLKNTEHSYGSMNKFLHWIIALFVLFMLTSGYFADYLPSPLLVPIVFNIHKLIGLLILALIIFRLIWRLFNPVPVLPPSVSRFETILAHTVQWLLYVSLILMPLSGWMLTSASGRAPFIGNFTLAMPGVGVNYNQAKWFGEVHSITAIIILALLSLHILGAFKHYFIDHDRVLQRMLPRFCHRHSDKKIG